MTESWKRKTLRRVAFFIVAEALMVIAGSAAHSVFVQSAWSVAAGNAAGAGSVGITVSDRVAWAAHDLAGMFVLYAATTSVALLVGFLLAGALARLSGMRTLIFGLAGAAAIFVLFTTLKLVLGTVGIFGARGPAGLAAQMAVGLSAGLLFAKLTIRKRI